MEHRSKLKGIYKANFGHHSGIEVCAKLMSLIVYVNGQSVLTPELGKHTVDIRYIEPEFKKLMEG